MPDSSAKLRTTHRISGAFSYATPSPAWLGARRPSPPTPLSLNALQRKCVLFVLVAICEASCVVSLTLSLSFTSDVDKFLFLYHLCFSYLFTLFFFFSSSSTVFVPVGIHKGSGSYVNFYPRSCSSTCRWARFSTHRHTLCVFRALVSTLAFAPPHVRHRQRLHILAHRFCLIAFTSENHDTKKLTIISSQDSAVICECCNACFPLRPVPGRN